MDVYNYNQNCNLIIVISYKTNQVQVVNDDEEVRVHHLEIIQDTCIYDGMDVVQDLYIGLIRFHIIQGYLDDINCYTCNGRPYHDGNFYVCSLYDRMFGTTVENDTWYDGNYMFSFSCDNYFDINVLIYYG